MGGLKARFLHGGFLPYLEQCVRRFDIVWASGVLYHQVEPVKLIGLISKVTDRVYLWTHYYDEPSIRAKPQVARNFHPQFDRTEEHAGFRARLFYRSYSSERGAPLFASGGHDHSYWMSQDDLLNCLRHFGFHIITLHIDCPESPNGPFMSFLAEKG